jgi:hypothetical protein
VNVASYLKGQTAGSGATVTPGVEWGAKVALRAQKVGDERKPVFAVAVKPGQELEAWRVHKIISPRLILFSLCRVIITSLTAS